MIFRFDDPICLNGWWDILPLYGAHNAAAVPASGWEAGRYLVPSFYNKPADAVRRPGDPYYTDNPSIVADQDTDNLYDAFGYPAKWTDASGVWVRRAATLDPKPGRHYFLIADAIGPTATVFVNGMKAAEPFREYNLPNELDMTPFLRSGENELAILLEDYERDENGMALRGTGNWLPGKMRGIQRDVWLVEKGEVYIDDLTVVTSLRKHELSLKYSVKNLSDRSVSVTLRPAVTYCEDESEGIAVPTAELTVGAGGCAEAEIRVKWAAPRLWDAFCPNLYWVTTGVFSGGEKLDEMTERFGFREVWAEGDKLLLNGIPLHLFSDFGHKTTPFCFTRGWIEQWFGMIKDLNMNHSRLHTHPHPELVLDLADEKGIYITSETDLHGSGGGQACGDPRYWESAHEHVRRLVKREKNHPSVVLYSCENEMRWNNVGADVIKREAPKIRELFNRLDPTRIAYHEGDSSLWDEKGQDLISRHYGKDCAGTGWWDHSRPLHSGEFCLFHYMGPNNTLQRIGDRGWREYDKIAAAATADMTEVVEDARANGVCCLGPWNFSCLANIRTHGDKSFEYFNWSAPGMKPLRARAGSCEFEFWNSAEKGYHLMPGTEPAARAFRPLAAIDRSRRSEYYPDAEIEKEIFIVNDTDAAVSGEVFCGIYDGKDPLSEHIEPFSVERGGITVKKFTLPKVGRCGGFTERLALLDGLTALDCTSKPVTFDDPQPAAVSQELAVIGDGLLKRLLDGAGYKYKYVTESNDLSGFGILLVEKDAVAAGGTINRTLAEFAAAGGRAVVFEQRVSPFPALPLVQKPVQSAFVRSFDSTVTERVSDARLRMWGDDPYTLMSGDSRVAYKMYRKDDGSAIKALADSGEGDFGDGDLGLTPLMLTENGRVAACQLRVTDKFATVPAAKQLIFSLIEWAGEKEPAVSAPARVDGRDAAALAKALGELKNGSALIVSNTDEKAAALISAASGVKLTARRPDDGIWAAVRAGDLAVLSGISNEDLCGLEKVPYCPADSENLPVAELGFEPADGLEALIETCPKSCLTQMCRYGQSAEMLRAYCANHYCVNGTEKPLVIAGAVCVGGGKAYFSAFAPDKSKRLRFERFDNLLYENLGGKLAAESPLAGACVPECTDSPGYPTALYSIPTAALPLEKALHYTVYLTERMNGTPVLNAAKFARLDAADGKFAVSGETLLYYTIFSPTVRKNLGSNLGVPDPGAQTFLDLEADGHAELYINSVKRGEADASGSCCFADLELESGLNHILVKFTPREKAGSIAMKWRNILRRPETDLLFMKSGM